MVQKCYLDIDIGDPKAFAELVKRYETSMRWLEQNASIYGLPTDPSALSPDQLELATESYASDPNWSSQAEALFSKPADVRAGRLEIDLFDDCPKTAENFRCLCTGERGVGKTSKKPLHYLGAKFFRIEQGKIAQGGDVVRGDGSGSDSIYNGKFNDEKPGLKRKHEFGSVSMANSGKNSNSCQFFLCLAPMPSLDGDYVVFGKVVNEEGLRVLRAIDERAASVKGTPVVDVTIGGCGVL